MRSKPHTVLASYLEGDEILKSLGRERACVQGRLIPAKCNHNIWKFGSIFKKKFLFSSYIILRPVHTGHSMRIEPTRIECALGQSTSRGGLNSVETGLSVLT